MAKIITGESEVNSVLTRGIEKIYPNPEAFKTALQSGKKLRFYCGFDPSAKSLHIGNAISLMKLAQLQKLGHEIIFLIGDFTGMIGDPTDKKAARQKLTRKEVLTNAKDYQKQAAAYLDFSGPNPAKIKFNSQWSDELTFSDLVELSGNFTVQQMLQRDMFQERLKNEKHIYLHEFLYPLAQAYDSVAMDVDGEIGGNDQTFNMLRGRDLMKKLKNKEKFVLTMKLLVDSDGKKMGKSEGNIVNLNETPENMYGQIMSWPDGVLASAFELCTDLPDKELARAKQESKNNPRDAKMKLALAITVINHGVKKAAAAQEHFVKTVQRKEAPDEVKGVKVKGERWGIVDLLIEVDLAVSKNEARRLIEQGGIKVDGKVVKNINEQIKLNSEGVILQRGKRQFIKVTCII